MYPVSKEYSAVMRAPIREATTSATVYLGVFDKTASGDASVSPPAEAFYSQPNTIIEPPAVTKSYATFEGSGFRLDGKQDLFPESVYDVSTQGYVSEAVADQDGTFAEKQIITISFGQTHDMAGLTLGFDEAFPLPKEVAITGYSGSFAVASAYIVPSSAMEMVELLLEEVDRLTIEFTSVVPNGRARLHYIGFGIGYSFSGKRLISTTEKHQGSPVMTSLPTASMEFSVYNENDMFGVGEENALSAFFAEGQEASVDYVVDWHNGSQRVPGGVWYLKSWDVDRFQATFRLENKLSELNNTTYQKGVFDNTSRTLYELAVAVLEDAGVEKYYVDPYLQKIGITAPIPIVSHGAALQLIANAARSRLFVDRDGTVCIETTVATTPTVVSDTAQTFYSKPETVMGSDNVSYMTFESGFARLDGSQLLLPDSGSTLPAGWVASDFSANGVYAENALTLHYDIPTNVFSVTVDWGDSTPTSAKISIQTDGAWKDVATVYPTKSVETYSIAARHLTDLRVSLSEGENGVRARIKRIDAGKLSDFTLQENQLFESSTSTVEVKLKEVSTYWTSRSVATEVTEIARQKVRTNIGVIEVSHNLASEMVASAELNGAVASGVAIFAEHYAYVSYVTLTSDSDTEVELVIKGKAVSEYKMTVKSQNNPTGEVLEIENPLFDSAELTQTVSDWVRDYYSRRVVHESNTRGFPELEYGDTIYFDDGSSAVITNLELTYNGALNSAIRSRR